jgi:hypothetical protein
MTLRVVFMALLLAAAARPAPRRRTVPGLAR